ncbi:MAG TPA: glycosyltransferase [Microbacteriaceae bacterium]|nr:glycosyltransferase [Microbacteriaceae bacterium]
MPAEPVVSVVVPAHRVDAWLDRAVGSVLASTDIDLELIVVFDGIAEAAPLWSTDPRVRLVFRPVSGGPSVAMQDGVDVASGTYIARLDSDDLTDPERLAVQVAHLDAHPDTVAVAALVRIIDEDDRVTGSLTAPVGDDVRRRLLLYNFIAHSTVMFRRDAALRIGGYDRALRVMEDYEFLLRLATLGPIAQLDRRLVGYRLHTGQTSHSIALRGPHIDAVLAGRRALAGALGVGRVATWARDALWGATRRWRARSSGAQIARIRPEA